MSELASLSREVSPPPVSRANSTHALEDSKDSRRLFTNDTGHDRCHRPSLAAIEAGIEKINNHLESFAAEFARVKRPAKNGYPRLSIPDFEALYRRNEHARGRHFVIHQHDHPVAGVHYDLRLQFSATSTISFSIPYGLPGNPNSKRPHRLAIETRVHTLWNNLVESASHASGSLLIWDTGEYTVLPRDGDDKGNPPETDDEDESLKIDARVSTDSHADHTDCAKLFRGFQNRSLKLRLNGTRLPPGYTINLRLPKQNSVYRTPPKPGTGKRKRQRLGCKSRIDLSSDDETEPDHDNKSESTLEEHKKCHPAAAAAAAAAAVGSNRASPRPSDVHGDIIRLENAYPGSSNTIGSIHQRNWIITLDRAASGYELVTLPDGTKRWARRAPFVTSTVPSTAKATATATSTAQAPATATATAKVTATATFTALVPSSSTPRDKGCNNIRDTSPGTDEPTDDVTDRYNEGFRVRGRDVERSLVTGRLASHVYSDEGVVGYVPRKNWVPILD